MKLPKSIKPLAFKFYRRDTTTVARELLGKRLFHQTEQGLTGGVIIETEAYLGLKDRACHTFGGRRTERVASMYRTGGHSYVYFIYGIHFCFNVVTQSEDEPEAVLVRALLPIEGVTLMRRRRKLVQEKQNSLLCSGPGKLCQALAIDRSCDGLKLNGQALWISEGIQFQKIEPSIVSGPRVGIDKSKEAKDWPLRFLVHDLNAADDLS